MNRRQQGSFGILILVCVLSLGAVAIWWGWGKFNERYYVALFDQDITRYIDVPPFATRISPSSDELRGKCQIRIGVSAEKANAFFASMSSRRGFVFTVEKESFTINIRRGYQVKGIYEGEILTLRWSPRLPEPMQKEFERVFGRPYEPPPEPS